MRWSSPIKIRPDQSQDTATVLDYQPRQFNLGTPDAAIDYLKRKHKGDDFVLSDALRETTGIAELEKESEEKKIEERVLQKVVEIQKAAYDEGYKLGHEEGLTKALEKKTSEINHGLEDLATMLLSIQNLKPDLISANESHIIHLVFQIAEKIAFDHIEKKPEIIIEVIRKAMNSAQVDEDVNVLVAPSQIEFIEKYKNSSEDKYSFLKGVKLQASENVQPGGCIIETNYGAIDARIHERVQKLWAEVNAITPKIKDTIE